jgi:hypothetical protein
MKNFYFANKVMSIMGSVWGILLVLLLVSFSSCDSNTSDEQDALIDAVLGGEVVQSGEDDGGTKYAKPFFAIDVGVNKLAVIECNLWGYPEICRMNGSKGKALARDDGDPTGDDFVAFIQTGSVNQPYDMTSYLYYSSYWYPFAADSSVDPEDIEVDVSNWGPGWEDAMEDYCDNIEPDDCI